MFDVGSAVGYLLLDTSNWDSGLKYARMGLKSFTDETASATDKWSAVGSSLGAVGKSLTLGATAPLLGLGAAAVKVGNDFEAQMSRVKSISGATVEEFEQLNELALQLGAETAFSASEAAQGMENLASAGFTVNEIMQAMPGLLDLAASSGADLATATEIAASAVRGFGLEADQTGHVADVFAEAAARTNAQTEDMGEAMKYIAPVAAAMGQSIEETAAAIGIMSDAGIKGSQAGTSLRGAFSRLAKPTEAMSNVMEDLGLSFYDTSGNMLPLNGIVSQLETNMSHLTQEQRNQALVTLFGQESLSGMLALMDRGSGELVSLSESFKQAEGAAAEMSEVMLDNTSGSVEEMFGSLETFGIKVQQVLAPVITDVVNSLTELINWLGSLDEDTLKLILTIAAVVAAVGPALIVLGKIITAVTTISTLIGGASGLGAILTTLATGPIGLIISALGLLFMAWQTNFGGIKDIVTSGIEFVSENIDDWINWIFTLPETFFQAGADLFNGLLDGLKSVWSNVTDWFEDKIDWITDKLSFWNNAQDQITASSVEVANRGGGFTREGSFASGLDYVPRDMNVRVHEGEAILTKQQNQERNQGSGSPETLVIPISVGEEQIETVIVDLLKREVRT